MSGPRAQSRLFHCFDRAIAKAAELIRDSYILCKLPRIDPAAACGLVILVCFLIPGSLWRNQYALILSAAAFCLMLRSNPQPLRTQDLGPGFLLFGFACVIGIGVSSDHSEGMRVFCFYAAAFLLCAAIVGSVTTQRQLHTLLGFLYGALLLTALAAFAQRITGVEPDPSLTDLTANAGMPGRVYSTLENPNNYAEFIVLTLPLAFAWSCSLPGRRKYAAIAGLLLPLGALLMTYSRSGWVSFALAVLVFAALWDRRLLLPLAGLAGMLIPFLPDSIFNRILTIGSTADSSNMYRVYIWQAAVQMLRRWGFTGIGLGPGNFTPLYERYCLPNAAIASHSHMLYLEVWLEMGVLGITGFLTLYLGTIRRALRARKEAPPTLRLILTACAAALIGISFLCAVEYIWHYPRILLIFFTVLGITLSAVKLSDT